MKALARQLARPHGLQGRLVARMLNRANRTAVTGAVKALDPAPAGHETLGPDRDRSG